jgi:ABC-type polysaccharide/polyol phosphate transport system ATPase subunit
VIEVNGVWKRFRRPHVRVTSLKEAVVGFLRGQTGYTDFWAVRDASLTVQPGEAVALIGPNGSGKSTLFAMVARVLSPTRGTIRVEGRVCPLLELGTGFHPELSGRDNVYLNASILGLSHRETQARYDSIVDFAELPEVMDAPVKTYSTGMVVRLGFSVAVHVDPEILLIDEVLSVGDEHFQHKSFQRLSEFKQQGKTICVVSHDLPGILKLCERAVWIERGEIQRDGSAYEVVTAYRNAVLAAEGGGAVSDAGGG